VVPQAIADEVFDRAMHKTVQENRTRDALRAGRRLAEVFEQYGVL
jgi:regulator of RNase E activity RraA